jgi:hypothetical protein
MLGLGGSIGTPAAGIEAEVLVVGLRGGNAYRDAHRAEIANHVLAIGTAPRR